MSLPRESASPSAMMRRPSVRAGPRGRSVKKTAAGAWTAGPMIGRPSRRVCL
jgi:hypothetical protein